MNTRRLMAVLAGAILILSTTAAFADQPRAQVAGAVYTMTNDSNENEVVIFDRDGDGMLTKTGTLATGGKGFGAALDPLGSQGSIALTQDKRWLLVVNAGSNDVSIFRVLPNGLALTDRVRSGGGSPVSLTVFHDIVYVLNADLPNGTSPNITGFLLSHKGQLTPLGNSTRSLASGGYGQLSFDPHGDNLVVTSKTANSILVFAVSPNGLPSLNPVPSPSSGQTPFGFTFGEQGHLLVVEAGANAVSSYNILQNGHLQVISASVTDGQKASCWIAGNEQGYLFTANPGSSTLSSFKLTFRSGRVTLLKGAAGTGTSPLDLAAVDVRFLYALDPNAGGIDMFKVDRDGTLTDLGTTPGGLSVVAQGIAAR